MAAVEDKATTQGEALAKDRFGMTSKRAARGADERLASTGRLTQLAAPSRGGRGWRSVRHHHHLRAAARRGKPLFAARVDDLPDAVGGAWHHRHRRRAAHHRRRVRPFGRLDGRLRRRRHRPDGANTGPAALGRHRLRLRGCHSHRLSQRPDRGEDAAALLHRHAGFALHPSRPVDRHHPRRHRPHADPLHTRRRAGPGHCRPVQRSPVHRPLPLDGHSRLDRDPQRRHPLRRRHPYVDRLVARR